MSWSYRSTSIPAGQGDPELLSAVIPLLDDENDTVRYNAAATVMKLGAKSGAN